VKVLEAVRSAKSAEPNKLALSNGRNELTFRSLNELIDRTATRIARLGVAAGDLVEIADAGGMDGVVRLLSVAAVDAIPLPLPSSRYRPAVARLADVVLERSGIVAKIAIVSRKQALRKFVQDDSVVAAFVTSGTTGPEKLVLHTDDSLHWAACLVKPGGDRKWLVPLNVATIGGYAVMARAWAAGDSIVIPDVAQSPGNLLALAAQERVTDIATSPAMLDALVQAATPAAVGKLVTLQSVGTGSAPLPISLRRAAADRLCVPINNGYGSTELGGPTLTSPHDTDVFFALPHVEVAVRSPMGDLTDGVPGELWCRPPATFRAVVQPDGAYELPRRDRWIATGDRAVVRDNVITLDGRVDDVILSGGWKFSALRVEQILESIPAVARAAVLQETIGGRKILVAYMQVTSEWSSDVGAIRDLVQDRLPPHERPRIYRFVDRFPETHNGKIKKHALSAGAKRSTEPVLVRNLRDRVREIEKSGKSLEA
jgi:acyl-coenzyme A synthetase/AMP-(fatty) acid ligase